MNRKIIIGVVVAGLLLLVAAYFVSPMVAANNLRTAATAGDVEKLERMVDFPAVRESLKGQLSAQAMASIQSDPELAENPFAGLAVLMVPAMVGQLVEGYVTAEGLGAMMSAERPAPGPDQTLPQAGDEAGSAAEFRHGYEGLNTYVLTAVDEAAPEQSFSFVMYRQGLFGWQLKRIRLPEAAATPLS